MMRLAFLFAAMLALAGCDFGPSSKPEWLAPSPALWEVRDEAGHRGWLFGTVHALPDGLGWRTGRLDAAVNQAGLVVVEIANLGETSQAATHFEALSTGAGLPPLLQRVPPSEREAVTRLLDAAGMDEEDFAGIETWGAALILANAVNPYDPANGVDRALTEQAKEVAALESYQSQFAIFDRLAAEDQGQLLVSVAHEARQARRDSQLEAWLAGDLALIERDALAGLLGDRELRQALLVERNRDWVEPIARMVGEGRRPFVAVGTAHMLTEHGLPALLKARGFAITRIQ